MTAPVIVFFHAVIAVSSESIFPHVGKYPPTVSCNLNIRLLAVDKFEIGTDNNPFNRKGRN